MANNTIILTGTPIEKYLVANAAITPGHLIERMSTNKVRAHSTAGGNCQKMFALEDDLQGNDISDSYAAAARVRCGIFARGTEVYALLANGQTAVIGSPLESAGDGTLQVHTPTTLATEVEADNAVVGYALEAVDMSGSSAVDPSGRIKVEVA